MRRLAESEMDVSCYPINAITFNGPASSRSKHKADSKCKYAKGIIDLMLKIIIFGRKK